MAVTWSATKGADLSWVPIGFTNWFRMDYTRTHYGTGYYIYQLLPTGRNSRGHWKVGTGKTAPEKQALDVIANGADPFPTGDRAPQWHASASLPSGQTNRLEAIIAHHPQRIRELDLAVPLNEAIAFGRARIRMIWDNRSEPSVDAPVALFFGAGTLYNRDHRADFVRAFPVKIHFDTTDVRLSCFFPMPFFKSASIELVGPPNDSITNIQWQILNFPAEDSPSHVGYFHATYRDHPHPAPGRDLVLLDTREVEGGGDWSGSFVGTSWIFSDRANLTTLEGDPRFFFDDSQTPQAQGTGTEEWGGGGDYWGGANMTLPFAGHPTGAAKPATALNDEDKIESAYRFLLADLFALRQKRAHLPGTRRHGPIAGTLPHRHLLVRRARAGAGEDRRIESGRLRQRSRPSLRFPASVPALLHHVALRMGRRYARRPGSLPRHDR